MNLHGIVSASVGAINPLVQAIVRKSNGYTTAPDGTQVPGYLAPVNAQVQVQALTAKELTQIDSVNQTSVMRGVYLNGDWSSLVRSKGKGGDVITFGNQVWLIIQVLESWPDWTKVAVALQTDLP